MVCEKAKALYDNLQIRLPGTSVQEPRTSHGWFENFTRQTGILSVIQHREAASSDTKTAEKFLVLKREVESGEQKSSPTRSSVVMRQDFLEKMLHQTYITKEVTSMPGHKPMKDRLALLFCSNTAGDFKIKPLLVYHAENP